MNSATRPGLRVLGVSRGALSSGLLVLGVLLTLASFSRPAAAVSITRTVSIHNYAYQPATMTVAAGETVSWTQYDIEQHSVTACTSATCPSVSGLAFDSGILTQGRSFRLTFASPGTYPYYCTVHTSALMHGTVVVMPLPPSGLTVPPPTVVAPTPAPPPTPPLATSPQPASGSSGSAVAAAPGATAGPGSQVTGPPPGTPTSGSAAILVGFIALGLGALIVVAALRMRRGGAKKD